MLYLSKYKRKLSEFEGMFWIGDGSDHFRAIAFSYIPDDVDTIRGGLQFLLTGDLGWLAPDEKLAIAILNLNDPMIRVAREGYAKRYGAHTGSSPRLRSDR